MGCFEEVDEIQKDESSRLRLSMSGIEVSNLCYLSLLKEVF